VSTPMFADPILECLKAPGGGDNTTLELDGDTLRCPLTGDVYPFIEGIPSLFQAPEADGREITDKVKTFYEEHPFPNYEGLEDFGELVTKGNRNPFTRSMLDGIGFNKKILECGCGTGQMSHFLQLNNNVVLGIDMSLGSLRLAVEHKIRNDLARSSFAQMNIFDLAVKDESFDVVISHGVLHHTFNARRAFSHIVRKVKPGGIVVVGLYNRYARIPTWVRSKLIGMLGPRIDFVVRNQIRDPRKSEIWIKDQYHNPHETWHSIDEIMEWFDDNHVEFLNCSPPILGTDGDGADDLFGKSDPGGRYQRLCTQLGWIGTIAREGALFDLIGRREG
jgi:SAM-dependent methyltransferase